MKHISKSCLILSLSLVPMFFLSSCQTVSKTTDKVTDKVNDLLGRAPKVPQVDDKGIVDISKTTFEQIQKLNLTLPKDQWVYIENEQQGIYNLQNKSKEGYLLSLRLTCKIDTQKPTFILSNADGAEILKAYDNASGRIQFLLDNKNYGNPFEFYSTEKFKPFKQAAPKAKVLKIFYAGKLYTFQNNQAELLNHATNCRDAS